MNVSLSDAANTVTPVTSATPIVSAAAVWAVREGFRMAFSWPSRPARPVRAIGAPMIRASGRATYWVSMAAPTNSTTAPIPISPNRWARPESGASIPDRTRATPSAVSTMDTIRRARGAPGTSMSRIAATGGTRLAFHAGTSAATKVTSRPTTRPTMIVRGSIWRLVAGSEAPMALKPARRIAANAMPKMIPMIEATSPMKLASSRTDRTTWLPDAPTAFRSPS